MVEIASALSTISALQQLTKGALDARDYKITQKAIQDVEKELGELLSKVVILNNEMLSLQAKNEELMVQNKKLVAWDAEKELYEMRSTPEGAHFYAKKDVQDPIQEGSCLCVSCYNKSAKSNLTLQKMPSHRTTVLKCHDCGSYAVVSGRVMPEHMAVLK